MARLNLTNFETVCTIARLGTFAAAAQRLHASQPAITARVRELEESLGFELFHKRGRRMELTIRGRHFIERIEPLVEGIEREVVVHAQTEAAVGVVRLGVPLVTVDWIPAVVAQLKQDMPRIDFEIDVDAGMSIIHKLQAGKLDVAITAAVVRDEELHGVPLRRQMLRWMACAEGLRDHAGADIATLLNTLPLWVVPRTSSLFPRVTEALREAGATLDNLNTCANMAFIVQMVRQTRGIGLVVDSMAAPLEEAGVLAPLPLAAMPFDITLFAHKDQQQAVVRRVIERIVEFDARRGGALVVSRIVRPAVAAVCHPVTVAVPAAVLAPVRIAAVAVRATVAVARRTVDRAAIRVVADDLLLLHHAVVHVHLAAVLVVIELAAIGIGVDLLRARDHGGRAVAVGRLAEAEQAADHGAQVLRRCGGAHGERAGGDGGHDELLHEGSPLSCLHCSAIGGRAQQDRGQHAVRRAAARL